MESLPMVYEIQTSIKSIKRKSEKFRFDGGPNVNFFEM